LSPGKESGIDISGTYKRATELTPNPYMIDFLLYMDEKLDQIMAILYKYGRVDKEPYSLGIGVNIGGAGMKIIADKPVEHGQIIHTSFVMSRLPFVFIDVFGEVIHVKPVDKDGKAAYSLGIKFLNLNLNDRESIIACVFQRQREIIRKMKDDEYTSRDS
jgi:c-di-GMP-binding flagellar brake protein YcgR